MNIRQKLQVFLACVIIMEAIHTVYCAKDKERKKRKRCPRVCLRETSRENEKLRVSFVIISFEPFLCGTVLLSFYTS